MSLQALWSFGCFVGTAIQAGLSILLFLDHPKTVEGGAMAPSNRHGIWMPFLLVLGAVTTAVVGGALLVYHANPKIVTITVEKAIPCPPSQSGSASTKGTESPAITGSNNGVNYGQPPPPKKP